MQNSPKRLQTWVKFSISYEITITTITTRLLGMVIGWIWGKKVGVTTSLP